MNDNHLRIGDEERERAASELGEHYASGRLEHAEYSERLDRVWAARTRGELPAVFRDLPGPGYGRGTLRPPFGAFPSRPAAPVPWAGRPAARRQPPLTGAFVVVLSVLVVFTVLSHIPVILVGLLVWFLLRSRGRRHHNRYDAHYDGRYGGGNPTWAHPGR